MWCKLSKLRAHNLDGFSLGGHTWIDHLPFMSSDLLVAREYGKKFLWEIKKPIIFLSMAVVWGFLLGFSSNMISSIHLCYILRAWFSCSTKNTDVEIKGRVYLALTDLLMPHWKWLGELPYLWLQKREGRKSKCWRSNGEVNMKKPKKNSSTSLIWFSVQKLVLSDIGLGDNLQVC